jgi:hypothetical protein
MMPMKIESDRPGRLVLEVGGQREGGGFHPLYTQVHNLGRDTRTLKKVSQSEDADG